MNDEKGYKTFEKFKHDVHRMVLDTLNERNILTVLPEDTVMLHVWEMYVKKQVSVDDVVLTIVVESTHINNVYFPTNNNHQMVVN